MKYKAAGLLILIPALMALVSGSFAMPLLTESWLAIVAGTLVFALIVLIVDRSVFIFIKPRQFNAAVAMRLGLIVALAFALSKPLELRIFQGEIENKLLTDEQGRKEEAQKAYETKVADLHGMEKVQADKVQGIQDRYLREMEGINGHWGNGPVAKQMKGELEREQKILDTMKDSISQRIKELQVDLEAGKRLASSFKSDLSVRLEALSAVSEEKKGVGMAALLLRLILVLIDLIPMGMKWMSRDEDMEIAELKADSDRDIRQKLIKALRPWRERVDHLTFRLKLEREESAVEFQRMKQMVDAKIRNLNLEVDRTVSLHRKRAAWRSQDFDPSMSRAERQELVAEIGRIYESFLSDLQAFMEQQRAAERQKWGGSFA